MFHIPSELLVMSSEPLVLAKNNRVLFANAAATTILGEDCVGRSIRQVFGSVIAEAQMPSYTASVPVGGEHCILRVSRIEGMQAIFFSRRPQDTDLVNDSFLLMLRNNLSNISFATQYGRKLLERGAFQEMDISFAAISKSYYMLNRLLSNFSTVRSLAAGDLPLMLSVVNMHTLCSELCASVCWAFPEVKVELRCEEDVTLWGDASLIEQMLLNLLSNCFAHAKGLSTVTVTVNETDSQILLNVSDDGCGIPPEQMPSLFHRFNQKQDLSELSSGAGLGLTVVSGAAEKHGGTLLLESRPGAGTSVCISLSKSMGRIHSLRDKTCKYSVSANTFLTGMADCLPESCFGKRFMD